MKQLISLCTLLGWVLLAPLSSKATALLTEATTPDSTSVSPDSVLSKKGWWTVSLETSNNSSFYGRNTATRFPYAALTVTYAHQTGLWASGTSYQLFNTEDFIDETDLSLGYSFKIRKKVDANVSYSRFLFSKNTPLVKAVTANAVSAYAALDWRILYTAVTTSYIFGGGNDIFLVIDNSRYVPLNQLWAGKRAVGLDPKFSITSGTQQFSETHTIITAQKNSASGGGSPIGSPVGGILDPLKPSTPNNGNSGNNSNGSTSSTTTTTVNRFKVLNYELKVPLVVSLGNFEIEPSWRYSIPVNLLEGDESKAQSFYTLNVNFTF